MSDWIDVAAVEDFPPNTFRVVGTDDLPILVVNLGGRYLAVDNICTHEYAELSEGEIQGEEIVCPWHGARFSLVSGAVLGPPACENLRSYAVRVTDGWVEVDAEGEGV